MLKFVRLLALCLLPLWAAGGTIPSPTAGTVRVPPLAPHSLSPLPGGVTVAPATARPVRPDCTYTPPTLQPELAARPAATPPTVEQMRGARSGITLLAVGMGLFIIPYAILASVILYYIGINKANLYLDEWQREQPGNQWQEKRLLRTWLTRATWMSILAALVAGVVALILWSSVNYLGPVLEATIAGYVALGFLALWPILMVVAFIVVCTHFGEMKRAAIGERRRW